MKADRVKRVVRPFLILLRVSAGASVLLCPGLLFAQRPPAVVPPTTADIQIVSAELQHFPKAIRIGAGPQAIEYQEALVLKLRADRKQVDSFPPDMQPFLYIGREEFRIFHEERNDERPDLVLTVHVPNWDKLQEGAPLVLTILHGGPARNPEKFVRPNTPRFTRRIIVDKR
jgi:hypothetical protein